MGQWQNVDGTNLLHLYHTDPYRHAFSFQTWCLSTRTDAMLAHLRRRLNHADHRPIITFVEGTQITDVECFAATLHGRGVMSNWEMELLRNHRRQLSRMLPPTNGVIMMNTPVDVCMRCVNIRGRAGEGLRITQEFQGELLDNFSKWLRCTTMPRIHVDTVNAFHHQPAAYEAVESVMHEVDDFIKRLHQQKQSPHEFVRTAVGYGVLSDDESDGEAE